MYLQNARFCGKLDHSNSISLRFQKLLTAAAEPRPPGRCFSMQVSTESTYTGIEVHDDGSKELDAGLRPLDHYKQVLSQSREAVY